MGYKDGTSAYANSSEKEVVEMNNSEKEVVEMNNSEREVDKMLVERFDKMLVERFDKMLVERSDKMNKSEENFERKEIRQINHHKMYRENYEDDDEFLMYVSKRNSMREDIDNKDITYTLVEILTHMNNRLMHLEYKTDSSYEEEKSKFLHYDRAISELND